MTPEERTALETQIERHVRRGELGQAYAALQRLSDAFPDELALTQRLAQVEASLDPAERRRVPVPISEPSGVHKSPMHQAEAFAAAGRYRDAIGIYRALLQSRPDWDLVKERLAELFQLAQVADPPRPPVNRENVLGHLLERITSRKRS